MNRRNFLAVSGAAVVTLAGGGSWYANRQGVFSAGSGPGYAPWRDWDDPANPRPLQMVRAAILAASPHNTQPWRFRVSDRSIELYLDARRSVAGLDPYLREAYAGIGCALENMVLAAAAEGYRATVVSVAGQLEQSAAGQPIRLAARVDLTAQPSERSELYPAIPKRHTNRSPYAPAVALPPAFTRELGRLPDPASRVGLRLFSVAAEREELVRISSAANLELYSDPQVEAGSEEWIRFRESEARTRRDGLTLDNLGLSPFTAAAARLAPVSLLRRAAQPGKRAEMYAEQMRSAALIGIITAKDRLDVAQTMDVGRLWQRIHLFATVRGIGARPCNEAIEMIDHERWLGQPARRLGELGIVLGDAAEQPAFLFLMGHPTMPANASPRRSLEEVVLA